MGLATLLGASTGPTIGDIQIDVSVRETHRSSATVSEVPIELGSDVAEHRRKLPDEVSLEGVLSNLPTNLIDRTALELSGETAEKRYQDLLDLVANADTFELITGLRTYPDMVFLSFEVDRDQTTGEIVRFRAVMRQLEFAEPEEASTGPTVPDEADAAKVDPTTDTGAKATTPAPDAVVEPAQGTLENLVGGAQGATGFASKVADLGRTFSAFFGG